MSAIVALYKFLEGKKTYIGMVLVLLSAIGGAVLPDNAEVWTVLKQSGIALGGLGVIDKFRRTVTGPE